MTIRARAVVASVGVAFLASSMTAPAFADEGAASGPKVRLVVVAEDAGGGHTVANRLDGLAPAGLDVVGDRSGGRTVTIDVPVNDEAGLVAAVEASPDVAAVVPETTYTLFDVPDDPKYVDQGTPLGALKLPAAWGVTHGSSSVVVAVVDSGVDVDHPDLTTKIIGTHDAVGGGASVTDQIGHGTMVASMAAASTDNHLGMAGSGWSSSILAVKVADSAKRITNAALADGIDWAVNHGADVINLSLGSEVNDLAVRLAVADAVAADVVVVAAAGNSGVTTKFYPAALPGVLAVGATTKGGGSRASFSQRGTWVDVGAPGVSIVGANADWQTEADYAVGDGTSFSSPLVAGIAALVRAAGPGLTQAQVRKAITDTSSNKDYGFEGGLVNAYAAVASTITLSGVTVTSPTPGQTVSGLVPVVVQAPDADEVRVKIVGGGPQVVGAVTSGASTVQLPTFGLAGNHTIRVVGCQASVCPGSGIDVPVVVDNSAPTITAPADDTRVTEAFVVSANSSSPAVRFVADGSLSLGTDDSAPFSLTVPISRLAAGVHSITAVACDESGTTCAANQPSTAVSVTVARLSPAITKLGPNPFSPNGDGRKDTVTLTYVLDLKSEVTVTVRKPGGAAFVTQQLGSQKAGSHTWTWKGKGGGVVAPSGSYSVVLDTEAVVGGEPLAGQVTRGLVVDTRKASLKRRSTTYPTVYPAKDGYRDATDLSVRADEPTASLTVVVAAGNGRTVWSKTRKDRHAGRWAFSFKGRAKSGARLPAGTYRFGFTAVDEAGNVTKTKTTTVKVSGKKLSKARTSTTTLTAEKSFDSWATQDGDSCSGAYRGRWSSGSVLWDSCPGGYVLSSHHVKIPKAVKYGTVRVGTYARGTTGSRAFLFYVDDHDDFAVESHLGAATKTHQGKTVRLTKRLLKGQKLRWAMVLSDGDRYESKTFTVTWTYYRLV